MPLLSDFIGTDTVPTRWKALDYLGAGSGTWTSPISGYIRVHAQAPGGAGRRAPVAKLGGPAGGSGGRAVKTYKVNVGDQFTWSVNQGGQTEGANGAGNTTWNNSELVATPGQGAGVVTGTSFTAGGGAGGGATGGDVNLPGAKGGDTSAALASSTAYAAGANGAGAPFNLLSQLFAATPGKQAVTIFLSTYSIVWGEQRGGGRGGCLDNGSSVLVKPGAGGRGGGGGGGSGYATDSTLTAYYFGTGGDGEVLIEVKDDDPPFKVGDVPFLGYRSSYLYDNAPSGSVLSSTNQYSAAANEIIMVPLVLEDDCLLDALGLNFSGSPNYFRLGVFDALSRRLVAQSAQITGTTGVVLVAIDQPFLKRGAYLVAVWVNATATVRCFATQGAVAGGFFTPNRLHDMFFPIPLVDAGQGARFSTRYISGSETWTGANFPTTLPPVRNVNQSGLTPLLSFMVK